MLKKKHKPKVSVARALAMAFLVSDWEPQAQAESAADFLLKRKLADVDGVWLIDLAQRVCDHFANGLSVEGGRDCVDELEGFIATDQAFRKIVKLKNLKGVSPSRFLNGRPLAALTWELPGLRGYTDLADWLEIERSELSWLANNCAPNVNWRYKRSSHYVVTEFKKRSSGSRLIESPKTLLKQVQRQINHEILQNATPHRAAHGFCRGKNVVSYVQPHVGKPCCLKLDLKDFFPSIRFGRVKGLFKMMGFDVEVATYLAALCTHSVDEETLYRATGVPSECAPEMTRLYFPRHLPQGAPTSPAVANLIAHNFDCRLAGLAKSAGVNYTRYADDLLFSGDQQFGSAMKRFSHTVGAIAIEEGFEVNFRKTRFMHESQRQSATGIVFNERINIDRREFDKLKAILTNCVRLGPETQNREGVSDFKPHLEGRIQWVRQLNPGKAKKLQAIFDRIDWD